MNILTWLRKLGYEHGSPVFRSIDIDGLFGSRPAEPGATLIAQPQVLPSASAAPRRREGTPRRWPDAKRPGRSPRHLKILEGETEAVRSTPVRPFRLAPEQHRPTPFFGREEELRCLLSARSRAAAGHGQVVLLSGDAGIGKSRLVRELRARQSHQVLWHRCAPEHALSPFHPVQGLLPESSGVPEAARAGLCRKHGQATGRQARLESQRLRSRTFELLLARIEQLADQQLLLAVYEDLQWADPSTLEFLDRMVDRIAGLPVLAIMTSRPEFEAAWYGHAHAVPLALASLERGPCQAMIYHVAAGATLAEPIVEQVLACAGGVPLLVEELTRAALEVDQGESAAAIPATLREGLVARLGPASGATLVAGIGAAVGREFSRDLLAAVLGWPQDRLQAALDQLVAAGLVLPCGSDRDEIYAFKHALLRDAAYQSAALPLRREVHGAIAQTLEARWPELAAGTPELLAQHYAAAGLAEPAAAWWLRAGQRASERCAQSEAIAMFGKGLELLDGLPTTAEPAAQRAELLAALAQALIVTDGLAAPEVAQACGMARTLFRSVAGTARLFPAVRGLWEYYNTRGDLEAACELAGKCQRLAAAAQEPNLAAEADFCLGVSSLFAGQLAAGRERLNRCVVRFEAHGRRDVAASEVRDLRIMALVHLAQALWLCGHPDQAVRASGEAVETARAAGDPFALTYALLGASWVHQLRRDVEATRALAADALTCATEADFSAFSAMARILRQWTPLDTDPAQRAAATSVIAAALAAYRATGMAIARPYLLGLLAEVHGAPEAEPALDVLDEAAHVADATGEHWYEPEIRRLEGALFLRQSITNRRVASARFCQAIAVAQQQGSKSLELRAAVSLARLWADVGRRAQARDLVAPIYGCFKEGFDTPDLADARTLLDELQ